jgi:hypothetical protein
MRLLPGTLWQLFSLFSSPDLMRQVGIYIPGKDDIPANSLDTMRWPFL